MNRRDFLSKIGYVTAASILPLSALPEIVEDPIALDEDEKYPQKWANLSGLTATTSADFYIERS